uniref:Uncharacterized protein n=1 Tax=viral metagenome TaxID=1070528 RepID=A0A6C0IEU4_9ZZZZ
MSFPPPTNSTVSTNPIENTINSLNSNPYFIGSMMILLNLGGRHLATGLTPEQDKFFQHPWFRRILIFVVFFVGTRNALTSLFMSILINLILSYLLNDQSDMYLLKPNIKEKKVETSFDKDVSGAPIYTGLTPEETEIHKRLTEKLNKISKIDEKVKEPEPQDISSQITQVYSEIMGKL